MKQKQMKTPGNLTSETFFCDEDFKSHSFRNLQTLGLAK